MNSAALISICVAAPLLASSAAVRAAEPIAPRFWDVQVLESAEATYAANAYIIVHIGRSNVVNEPGSYWRPVRGLVFRLSVERDVFFNSLGRRDLSEQFVARERKGRILKTVGYVAACAGVLVAFWGFGADDGRLMVLAGFGALFGGAATREVGEAMLRPTFPEDQAIDMAARYNQLLRARLGLSAAPNPAPSLRLVRDGRSAVVFAPVLLSSGVALAVDGRF